MMAHPRIGQRLQVWYAVKPRRRGGLVPAEFMPYHGKIGTVCIIGRSKPLNHGIDIDGKIVAIPCGNLRRVPAV